MASSVGKPYLFVALFLACSYYECVASYVKILKFVGFFFFYLGLIHLSQGSF